MYNAFQSTLTSIFDMQVNFFTVELLSEPTKFGERHDYDHIIIPDGTDRVIDFKFLHHHCGDIYSVSVTSFDLTFGEALTDFSSRVCHCSGSLLKLYGM